MCPVEELSPVKEYICSVSVPEGKPFELCIDKRKSCAGSEK